MQPQPRSPRRVKVTGNLFHGAVPAGAVYVGRAAPGLPASPYRNMFIVKSVMAAFRLWDQRANFWASDLMDDGRVALVAAIAAYAAATGPVGQYRFDLDVLRFDLAGRDLACWCPPTYPDGTPRPCHVDVLLPRANARTVAHG